jgi:hypothetical protein
VLLNGQPAANHLVIWYPEDLCGFEDLAETPHSYVIEMVHRTYSGANGLFGFDSLPIGDCHLVILGEDHRYGQVFEEISVRSPQGEAAVFALSTGSLGGRVLDPLGRPIAQVRITARSDELPDEVRSAFFTLSDSEGRFELQNLTQANYELECQAPGFRTQRTKGSISDFKEQEVVLQPGGWIRLEITGKTGLGSPLYYWIQDLDRLQAEIRGTCTFHDQAYWIPVHRTIPESTLRLFQGGSHYATALRRTELVVRVDPSDVLQLRVSH